MQTFSWDASTKLLPSLHINLYGRKGREHVSASYCKLTKFCYGIIKFNTGHNPYGSKCAEINTY